MWFRETALCLVLRSMDAHMSEFLNLSAQSGMKSCSLHTSQQLLVKTNTWRLFAEKKQVRACPAPGKNASLLHNLWGGCVVTRWEIICLKQQHVYSDFASETVFRVKGSEERIQQL